MNFEIIPTSYFSKQIKGLAKKYPSLKSDLSRLRDQLLKNPTSGTPLGKNCYKIRMTIKSKGKGKSGGGRVITCLKVVSKRIYLLSIYDKSEKENTSDKELERLLELAGL